MLVVRILGGGIFAAALISLILDVRHGLGTDSGFALTSLENVWLAVHADGLSTARDFVLGNTPAWVWSYLLQPLLLMPIALIGGLIGYLLIGAGRTRRRRAADGTTPSLGRRDGAQASAGAPALASALASCRGAFVGIALFSGMSNILLLTGSMFMLEVYDRVLPSRSIPTLIGLSILAAVLFVAQGGFDLIRSRLLSRVGATLDETLSPRVYDTMVHLPVRMGARADSLQPLRDLDSVRSFLSSMGPTALFDLPWMPLYLSIIFAFHWILGVTALGGAIVLVCLTGLTEIMTRKPTRAAIEFAVSRQRLAETSRRNAEVMVAMGLTQRVGAHWRDANRNYIAAHQAASDVGGGPRRAVQGPASDAAIGGAGGGCLSRHHAGGERGHHHCRIDPVGARAGARRPGHRPLEGLCFRAPELAAAEQAVGHGAGRRRAHGAAGADQHFLG